MIARTLCRSRPMGIITALMIVVTDLTGVSPVPCLVGSAEARIGQPLTARSLAGVSRRTTRRVIRQTAVSVAALPDGCVKTMIGGVAVWRCGSAYYQPYGGRYVVVVFD